MKKIYFYIIVFVYGMQKDIGIKTMQAMQSISFHEIIEKSIVLDNLLEKEKAIELCRQCEEHYNILRKKLENHPVRYILGEISYDMTLHEMKQKIKEKLIAIKKQGLIISKDEFKKIEKKYFDCPFTNLTRIWGGEYLKNKIIQSDYLSKKYDIPSYVIVVDDPSNIKIMLDFFNPDFPTYIFKNFENAAIYFEQINGDSSYETYLREDLSPMGFNDFLGVGNIRKEGETGKYYIIDTEYKSFKIRINDHNLYRFILYSSAKFSCLNDLPRRYEITINLEQ